MTRVGGHRAGKKKKAKKRFNPPSIEQFTMGPSGRESPPRGPRSHFSFSSSSATPVDVRRNSESIRPRDRERSRERDRSRDRYSNRYEESRRRDDGRRWSDDRREKGMDYYEAHSYRPGGKPFMPKSRRTSNAHNSDASSPHRKVDRTESLVPKVSSIRKSISSPATQANQTVTSAASPESSMATKQVKAAEVPETVVEQPNVILENLTTHNIVSQSQPPVIPEALTMMDLTCQRDKEFTLKSPDLTGSAQDMADLFRSLINDAIDASSLQTQSTAAKKRLDRRAAEFERSKQIHETYPATKESQNAAVQEAEKEYKSTSRKSREKKALLATQAEKAAEIVMPYILARGGGNKAQEHLVERCEKLENTCAGLQKDLQGSQQRCDALENNLNEHRKFLEDLKEFSKKTTEDYAALQKQYSESKLDWQKQQSKWMQAQAGSINEALDEMRKEARGSIEETKTIHGQERAKADDILKRISQVTESTEDMKKDIAAVKQDTTQLKQDNSLAPSLAQQLENISVFQGLKTDVGTLEGDLERMSSNIAGYQTRTTKQLNNLDDKIIQYSNNVTSILEQQTRYNDTVSGFENRIKIIEEAKAQSLKIKGSANVAARDFDALSRRVTSLEQAHATLSVTAATSTQVDAVKQQFNELSKSVKLIESKPDFNPLPELTKLDNDLKIIRNRIAALEGIASGDKKRMSVPEHDKSTALPQLSALETRLLVLENRSTSDSINVAGDDVSALTSRIEKVEADLELLQSDEKSEAIYENMGLILQNAFQTTNKQLVSHIDTQLESRVSPLADKMSQIESNLSDLQTTTTKTLANQGKDIADAKNTLVGVSAGKVLQTLSEQGRLPDPGIEARFASMSQYQMNMNNSMQAMGNSIHALNSIGNNLQANEMALSNLQHRFDNVQTNDIHQAMVATITETFPDLRNTQQVMNRFNTSLQTFDTRLNELDNKFLELRSEGSLASHSSDVLKRAETMREELDDMAATVNNLQDRLNSAEGDLSVKTNQAEHDKQLLDIADNITKLEVDRFPAALEKAISESLTKAMTEVENGFKKANGRIDTVEARIEGVEDECKKINTRSETARTRADSLQSPVPARPNVSESRHRQASNVSMGSGSSDTGKKRKHQSGIHSNLNTGNGYPKKPNGHATNRSPPAKKQRVKNDTKFIPPDDDPNDRDFAPEEDIPDPAISDEE